MADHPIASLRSIAGPPFTVVLCVPGNIGSQVDDGLGHLPLVERVRLIGKDRHTSADIISQKVAPTDVGKAKVQAQRRRLKRVNPRLSVTAIHADLRFAPGPVALGMMVLTCCVAHVWSYPMLLPVVTVKSEVEYSVARDELLEAPVLLGRMVPPGLRCEWGRLTPREGAREPTLTEVFQPAPTRRYSSNHLWPDRPTSL